MEATMCSPQENLLVVNVADASMMPGLRRAIRMMRGVTKVSVPRKRRMSDYERALNDVKAGHLNSYASVDDFFAKMGL